MIARLAIDNVTTFGQEPADVVADMLDTYDIVFGEVDR